MNSFISWIGGKKALREVVLERFPLHYSKYIEVFGGAAWVLFHKPPGREVEVYNDFNRNLANLYLCVQNKQEELLSILRYSLNSEALFERLMAICREQIADMPDVRRAAEYLQLIRFSYGSGCDSFGGQPCDITASFPSIEAASYRLRNVVILNRDFSRVFRRCDGPDSFFYCDPPYYGTESYYDGVNFTQADHQRLSSALAGIEGKWLLSYNDCPEIRALYKKPGLYIEEVSRLNNIRQQFEGGSMYAELLISNYDMSERRRSPEQMRLDI